jgi:hypothetical protein
LSLKPKLLLLDEPLAGLSDKAAARQIHDDGVHVLLDLAGHTGHHRLPVFAWKPAPVQASCWNPQKAFLKTGAAVRFRVLRVQRLQRGGCEGFD